MPRPSLDGIRKRLSGRRVKDGDNSDRGRGDDQDAPDSPKRRSLSHQKDDEVNGSGTGSPTKSDGSDKRGIVRRSLSVDDIDPPITAAVDGDDSTKNENGKEPPVSPGKRKNIFQRIRERSRSRSRSRGRNDSRGHKGLSSEGKKEMLVAVTSCRSDGYYNQRAPGSTSKLPRKAPTNLKLFHELAVGVKDAYAAVSAEPKKPDPAKMSEREYEARLALWDFVGNLDFLLALVDEVAVDTVTRGALKEDNSFKSLRDVIKKGNRVLEDMLVRRERKYTLFFRLVQPHDEEQIGTIKAWNMKVEKAVGAVTDRESKVSTDESSDASSTITSSSSATGSVSSRVGVFSRGRQLLPTAGKVRSRRATPTPRLRKHRGGGSSRDSDSESDSDAGMDGFAATTGPDDLQLQSGSEEGELYPSGLVHASQRSQLAELQPVEPKDELIDVIRGLRVEKLRRSETKPDEDLAALKPTWRPKAEIPSTVPKLPTEYVHRHRLMKQVVSCLLDETEPQHTDDGQPVNTAITSVTSRHGDKAGNGKSTLAVAVIQTVEVRERFADGIAWLKLGPAPLTERDVRRLYEDLYRQLIVKEADMEASVTEDATENNMQDSFNSLRSDYSQEVQQDRVVDRADSVRRFQGGDLEGIKEDLARMIVKRNILICLDDVWRVEDAKWFIFETPNYTVPLQNSPYKLLVTTRIPSLFGNSVQEVFVRIFSEHEAVKLLLSTAGRRPYGGRNSAVFNQSKMIVKGCGNSPLGILLVGSMLRHYSRNWNLSSPVWTGVFNQCTLNLEEAAHLRSFKNAFTRIADMCFFTIEDPYVRIALRRCFVFFPMAFRTNDWMLSGRGIPQSVVLSFFGAVIDAGPTGGNDSITPELILEKLESLKLMLRARHAVSRATVKSNDDNDNDISESYNDNENSEQTEEDWEDLDDIPKRTIQQYYVMHDSLKAVAERMAGRDLPCFTPDQDSYVYFTSAVTAENKIAETSDPLWVTPLRFLFRPQDEEPKDKKLTEEKLHELVVISLVGCGDGKALSKTNIADAMRANQLSTKQLLGGDKFEEYTTAFLPEHLMNAQAYPSAAELLTNADFVCRRIFSLGIMEATGRQVEDVHDLRNSVTKGPGVRRMASSEDGGEIVPILKPDIPFDLEKTILDASRIVIDEVYKVTNNMGASDSLGMATCLATVGEALLKCRQPRDAMMRLEEAVSIYRGLLGPYHVYVAHALHSVAKALAKLGETRVSLLKFAEAARIYETCNATLHYDSISNAQALASLLVDIGDLRKAEAMFEEVIAMKQAVYGENSVQVAKTINSYAILLAKHSRMNDALRHYEIARATYMKAPTSLIIDPEFEAKCNYDMTLITLNIASIYAKKGDVKRALQCYEEGVKGLEEYEGAMDRLREVNGAEPSATQGSSHKHIIAALSRIGSMKLKLGDVEGALAAYRSLIDQVDDDSPISSHIEKAKAHIKCATISRKGTKEDDREKAITHLKEAHRMYKALYEPNHKDTMALATTLKQWLMEDKASTGGKADE